MQETTPTQRPAAIDELAPRRKRRQAEAQPLTVTYSQAEGVSPERVSAALRSVHRILFGDDPAPLSRAGAA